MTLTDRLLAIRPAAVLEVVGFCVVIGSQIAPLAEASGVELSRPLALSLAIMLLMLREAERRLTRTTQAAALDETPPHDAQYIDDLKDEVARLQRDNAALLAQRIAEADTLPGYALERKQATEGER